MTVAENTPKEPKDTGHARARHSDRLEIRLTAKLKRLSEQAAAYEGRSAADFARDAIQRRAQEVVRQHAVWTPTDQERDSLLEALRNPPRPNARLKRAIAGYRKKKDA